MATVIPGENTWPLASDSSIGADSLGDVASAKEKSKLCDKIVVCLYFWISDGGDRLADGANPSLCGTTINKALVTKSNDLSNIAGMDEFVRLMLMNDQPGGCS